MSCKIKGERKMSKKSKRKIDLKTAILVLLLLAALLFASTYAWFTANTVVSVSDIDVRIEAKSGLQISADGEHWKSMLTIDDLKDAAYIGNANQLPSTMEPVSTIGEVDSSTGFMKMFYGTVQSQGDGFALSAAAEPAEPEAPVSVSSVSRISQFALQASDIRRLYRYRRKIPQYM